MKTVLVTGGAGFIGSHLCDYLISRNYRVICIDNLSTGSKNNINHLTKNINFTFLKRDITKSLSLPKIKINQIYNLACPASPIHYQKDPLQTIKINTVGIINLLELAKKHKARILQASTSEVYGDPKEHPQKETYLGNVNLIGPRACYDEGKRIAETLFFEYQKQHKLDIRVARIFNTYGPRMAENDGRVISNFIVQALKGNALAVYGDGMNTRSFCYIRDLVRGIYLLMDSRRVTGPVNLGNPQEFTILELAKMVINATRSKSKIKFVSLPIDDPRKRRPDISKARKILKWQPKVTFKEGLGVTISYFREIL